VPTTLGIHASDFLQLQKMIVIPRAARSFSLLRLVRPIGEAVDESPPGNAPGGESVPASPELEVTDPDAIVGGIDIPASPADSGALNNAISPAFDKNGRPVTLTRLDLGSIGSLPRRCRCTKTNNLEMNDIRDLSDQWMDGGTTANTHGFSNMLWSWGQFIDHDLVGAPSGSE
jgi:hypothetical protein